MEGFALTGLTWSCFQMQFCLRQHGTSHYICCSFFAHRAKNEQQKEGKVPLCITTSGHRVCLVRLRDALADHNWQIDWACGRERLRDIPSRVAQADLDAAGCGDYLCERQRAFVWLPRAGIAVGDDLHGGDAA